MSHRPLIALLFAGLLAAVAGCGGDSTPETPAASSRAERLGEEIAQTYLTLLDDTGAMIALNLSASQLQPALRAMLEDYRVRFANLGCLREDLDAAARGDADAAAAAFIDSVGPLDADWLRQATSRYGGSPEIAALVARVPGLQIYAFFDRLAEEHPGEVPVCAG